ncbi:hypothetical protein HHE02_01950 [Helicobacter heilmannii]|nr:hypothetical protein HHE02_01950 [Helicobacter heilmannii]
MVWIRHTFIYDLSQVYAVRFLSQEALFIFFLISVGVLASLVSTIGSRYSGDCCTYKASYAWFAKIFKIFQCSAIGFSIPHNSHVSSLFFLSIIARASLVKTIAHSSTDHRGSSHNT